MRIKPERMPVEPVTGRLTLTHVWAAMAACCIIVWILLSVFSIPHLQVWGWSTIIVAAVTSALISINYPKRVKLHRLAGRESLSDEQIYERFYRTAGIPKDQVLEAWHRAASTIEVPSGLLRPTDRFDNELSAVPGWHFYDDGLDILLAHTARELGIPADQIAGKIETLDALVRLVSTRVIDGG